MSRRSVSISEARDLILASVARLGGELVGLRDAVGRVLDEEIRSSRAVPPRDNSGMDGYALRSEDVQEIPAELRVVVEIPAGSFAERKLAPGEAARIFTGAAIPEGADAVVMQEYTERAGERVTVQRAVEPGENIRPKGSDVVPGTPIAASGTLLRPAHVGMLAALGRTQVAVVRAPRVAILATGDELVEPDRLEHDGRIASSNSYGLQAALVDVGAVPLYLGIAPDEPDAIEAAFREGLRCDAVISTGGVSVGDRDWIKQVLAALGGELRLWRVRMKPGAPLAFVMVRNRPVFGLPGNPVSTLVTFEQFVRPALLTMMGRTLRFRRVALARLAQSYCKPAGRAHLVRVRLEQEGEELVATPTGDQSSAILLSMVSADGLAYVPEETTELAAGSRVPVQLLQSSDLVAEPGF